MEYLRLLYELPAIVASATIVAYLLPWKFETRFAPLLMLLVGLLVHFMPEFVDIALALTIPAAYAQNLLGISLHGHEPLRVTLPTVRLPRRKKPIALQEFATKAYGPDAGPCTVEAEDDEDEDAPPQHEPPAQVSTVKSYVPSLLD